MTTLDIIVNPVGSKFAKALQQQLQSTANVRVFRRLTPKTVPAKRTIISRRGNILRQGTPAFVREFFQVTPHTLNKVEQFAKFTQSQVSCPKYATTAEEARNLGAKTLFARTLVNSTNGRGIVEFEQSSVEYPRAPLYTEYIPKKAEYRVHVFNEEVIDIQQKKKRRDFDGKRDSRIRNCVNGYCYTRDGIIPPAGIGDLAVVAVSAVGYMYGAVDIIYNEKQDKCFVLEVNSRPGLMGTTLQKYGDALIKMFNLEKK
jgi:hypothetical protein